MSAPRGVERHALIVGVRPERREEYLRLHSAVWPQVEQTLRDANITNYSIFIVGDMLFAYYEYVGDDHEADLAKVGEDPVTREWWTHTDPCQVRIVEERIPGALWQPIEEIWHLS
ncbi:L-rhamnose mutarotase [Dactylosporangium sp. NBC_01737]|uniref:L-rhamnose mutarotase n=1 Tax=Dactylosporangium sp. NBC_01737 TaxID=2975959 RepID=UPI002E116CD4|nr:L-rhamnose mutarotase [Dactylosporangium sp. NBC_01737]